MQTTLVLSSNTLNTAGIILLTIVAVEYGGWFILRVVRGRQPATPFQQAFFRAGHAHASVLLVLALVGQDQQGQDQQYAAHMSGMLAFFARTGIWAAALLMSAGFFLSAGGRGVTEPIASSCCST